MHPHQAAVAEWVAVVIAEGTFGRGPDVCEDEVGSGFGRDSLEVDTVPGRRS